MISYGRSLFRGSLAACLILAIPVSPLLASKLPYLTPGKPDGVELLPPPPAPGSPEQEADLNSVKSVFVHRSATDKHAAETEGDFDVFVFGAAIGPFFQKKELPKTDTFFSEVNSEVDSLVKELKNYYRRPRPCDVDPKLLDGPVAHSFGYPSRHSAAATTDAMILSQLFPEKADALATEGRRLGWLRVVDGRHYPTDTMAGRVLGRAIFHELWKNTDFQHDFAEMKTELLSAEKAK